MTPDPRSLPAAHPAPPPDPHPDAHSTSPSGPLPPSNPAPLGFRLVAIGCGVAAALAAGLGLAALAGIDVPRAVRNANRAVGPTPTAAPTGFMVADPLLGHRHEPGTRAYVKATDFDVVYTVDALGARRIPSHEGAPGGRPVVEMMGDSFTFGHGVEDVEPCPAVLQADHWPDVEVRNRGVNGYGPFHSLRWLSLMDPAEPAPARVLFGWLHIHLTRIVPDPHWLAMVERSEQQLPYYRLIAGQLVFEGLIAEEDALEADDPALVDMAWANTEATFLKMDRLAADRGSRITLILLPHRYEEIARQDIARMREIVTRTGISAIDLAEMPGATDDALYLPDDGHPNAEWHRQVAAAIARALPEP